MDPEDAAPEAMWRAKARAFAEREVVPIAASMDERDRAPEGFKDRLAREGFLGVGLPKERGGQGGNARCTAAVIEELARASAAVATLVSVHLAVCAQPIDRWGTEAQKGRYLVPLAEGRWLGAFALTEPGAGSDAGNLQTSYVREGGGFVLDGSKMFITNGGSADLLLTFARAREGPSAGKISAFLLPRGTPGFTAPQRLDKLGLRGSETNGLQYDGVRLPEGALLGPEGRGLALALGALAEGRIGIAACGLGVAQAAFEELRRVTLGDPQEFRRNTLAQAFTRLAAARALVERAAAKKDHREEFTLDASAAKLASSQAAVWIAERAVDAAGPEGGLAGARAGRLLRDARVFPIVEGTTEIQEMILGRALAEP